MNVHLCVYAWVCVSVRECACVYLCRVHVRVCASLCAVACGGMRWCRLECVLCSMWPPQTYFLGVWDVWILINAPPPTTVTTRTSHKRCGDFRLSIAMIHCGHQRLKWSDPTGCNLPLGKLWSNWIVKWFLF